MDKQWQQAVEALTSVQDFVRWGASRFEQAGLHYGHGADNAIDEALALVLFALHLPHQIPPEFMPARLTRQEKEHVCALLHRRISERIPAAYLSNTAWFAGLKFYVDERVLVPRSPIAELIQQGFEPWIDSTRVGRVLDLCTGSGCIAIASALAFPDAVVDAADISPDALAVAAVNVERHHVGDRLTLVESNLFESIAPWRYDVIVSNPPYVSTGEMATLPAEYGFEPGLGLVAGEDGLDCVRRILAQAREYLSDEGILVVEVGNSADNLVNRFPDVPFTWVEFERGGEGVFLLTAQQLEQNAQVFLDKTAKAG